MTTALIVAAVVLVLLVAGSVWVLTRNRRLEHKRAQAQEHRAEAYHAKLEAQKRLAAAEERAARARHEAAVAEQEKAEAGQVSGRAQELFDKADRVDPDIDLRDDGGSDPAASPTADAEHRQDV